jgi:hypothetical protein
MSNNVKRQKAHIQQPLAEGTQRVRQSRHGKPQMQRKRTVAVQGNGVVMSSALVPMIAPRPVKVAAGPTSLYGNRNTGGANAGKKSAKPA